MKTGSSIWSIIVPAFVLSTIAIPSYIDVLAQTNANDIYSNKSMSIPSNLNHIVILIPNEAHESINQPRDQYPLIDQAYLPQNATLGAGTAITWFNADVDHDHRVTLTSEKDPNVVLFDSGTFGFGEASQPIILNDTGRYHYYESNVNDNDKNFVMRGDLDVVSKSNTRTDNLTSFDATTAISQGNSTRNNADSIGVIMIPTQDIDKYVQTIKNQGFTIASMHDFKDLRGGQKGTGDHQTLLVWTTSGTSLNQIMSTLRNVISSLPYS